MIQGIVRLLKLYRSVVRFSVSRAMEFRFDFFFRFFMDCVYYVISIGFFEILFMHTENLGGWRSDQVLLFLSGALLLDSLYMTVIARNIWEFPTLINKGELDFYLTRPTPSLLTVMLRYFECTSLLNVFVGIGFMLYALSNYAEPFTLIELLGFLFLLMNGFFSNGLHSVICCTAGFLDSFKIRFPYAAAFAQSGNRKTRSYFQRGCSHLLSNHFTPFRNQLISCPLVFRRAEYSRVLLRNFIKLRFRIAGIIGVESWAKDIFLRIILN
jgi:hypothetical protein